jgi:ABC-type polysaccharide/polyol phosphate transport system ATPase subunit
VPDKIAISVESVSKTYRIWESPTARLTAPLLEGLADLLPAQSSAARWLKKRAGRDYRNFDAIKAISFRVRRGESVGIIGRNGSGKSTLLQIIASTLQSTEGSVKVNGRVAALLELGSGFNPEFTGRENVYLNGAVLGLTRIEIDARFDAIAAFADIGTFIDQPVKTYSSGMMMRLAFSVQTAVEPDILIVDEALSVGDAAFVAKCIKRVSDFLRGGGTLLFVSHDPGLVKQLTTRALYLDQGQQIAFGDTGAVALAYNEAMTVANNASPAADPDHYSAPHAAYRITSTALSQPGAATPEMLLPEKPLQITVSLEPGTPAPSRLVYSIYNYLGLIVCSGVYELPQPSPDARRLQIQFLMPNLRLSPGSYRMNFAVRHDIEIVSWARSALNFRVMGDTTETYIYREDTVVSFDFS